MSKKSFDWREWVKDAVTGTVCGIGAGAVGAVILPDPPLLDAMLAGGAGGLAIGLLEYPIRWLIDRWLMDRWRRN